MIELLIVIALLGALAVGLLAAVDPFEQLKKGTDTSRRNTVAEFFNAAIRYYSTNNNFPWVTVGNPTGQTLSDPSFGAVSISNLQSAGELKQNFSNLAGGAGALNNMFVTAQTGGGTTQVIVCFIPQSKSFQFDKNAIYDFTGGTTISNCKASSGAAGVPCYWCIQ